MKKYYIHLVLFFMTATGFSQAPNWNWAIMPDSMQGFAITTDNVGNIFVAGSGVSYLKKYDASGNLLWAKNTTIYGCDATEIYIDNSGNIYLAGSFSATASSPIYFDTIALTSYNNSRDLFTAKLDSAGNVKWAKRAGGNSDDYWCTGISTDGAGNVYVTGGVNLVAAFVFGNDTLQSPTSFPCFSLLKYDTNGNEIWGRLAGYNGLTGSFYPSSAGISTDDNGNSYITGTFTANTIDFGGVTLPMTTTGYPDYFFAKYDSAGNVLWAKGATGLFAKWGKSVNMDNSGFVYVVGSMDEDTDFDTISLTSPGRCFIVKYDTSGSVIWAKNFGDNYYDRPEAASVDASGNIFITGVFYEQTFSFGNSTCNNVDPSQSTYDIFVVKYDSIGNELWAKSAGSDTCDDAWGIQVDAYSNAHIIGRFHAAQFYFDGIVLSDTTTCWCSSPFMARLDHCSAYYTLYADTVPHNWIAVNQASGIAPVTYLWDWGDGTFSSGATPSHVYNTPGFYNICLTITDGQGCTNTYCDSSIYLIRNSTNTIITINVINQATGNAELVHENLLKIFPNPATSMVQISVHQKDNTPMHYEIINMLGEKVYMMPIPLIPRGKTITMELDVSFLTKGIYIFRVGNGSFFEYTKLVVE